MTTVRTLAERIDWVLKNRGLNMASWGLKAGLSRGVVSQALKREGEGNGGGFGSVNNLKLAEAAAVDPAWLSTGQGEPEPGGRAVAQPSLANPAIDTQQIANAAARMLVELDGLTLPDALLLVYDVRLSEPTVDGYYRTARRALATRAANETQMGSQGGTITREMEDAAEREFRAGSARRVVGAKHKRQ